MVVAIVTSSQILKPPPSHSSRRFTSQFTAKFFPFSTLSHPTLLLLSPPPPPPPPPWLPFIPVSLKELLPLLLTITVPVPPTCSVRLPFSPPPVILSCSRICGTSTSWELASALKEAKPRFDSAGVKLIAVGVGTPDKARMLAERLPFPMDCLYADPDHKAYDVLGLYYGFGRTFFNPASFKILSRLGSVKKAMKNFTLAATPDDRSSILQQGGMFVFKGKQVLYARKDNGSGDHAPFDDVFDVCCKVPVA